MMRRRHHVAGEDAPRAIAGALATIGIACAAGAAFVWTSGARAAEPSRVERIAPPPPPITVTANAPPPPIVTASASASAAPAPSRCPALIIVFESGLARAPATANDPLANLGQWLAEHPTVSVTVDGHADANGDEEDNLRLSRQRAAFVTAALVRSGATATKIATRGFGAFLPVDDSPPDAKDNRRVVIQTKGDACPREHEEVIEP